jgi:hypothetical protein
MVKEVKWEKRVVKRVKRKEESCKKRWNGIRNGKNKKKKGKMDCRKGLKWEKWVVKRVKMS